MTEKTPGPKEMQLRHLRDSKAAKRAAGSRKKQQKVKLLRKQINRKTGAVCKPEEMPE